MKNIIVITSNKNKAQEISEITGLEVEAIDLDLPEIQSMDIEEVASAKVKVVYDIIGKPVVVDDTGLYLEALNGLPGPFIYWFVERIGAKGILKLLAENENRKTYAITCIAYADEKGVKLFSGRVEGKIATAVRGKSGFGYDPIFIPDGYDKTFAEMDADEKNAISMRKIALEKFSKYIKEI